MTFHGKAITILVLEPGMPDGTVEEVEVEIEAARQASSIFAKSIRQKKSVPIITEATRRTVEIFFSWFAPKPWTSLPRAVYRPKPANAAGSLYAYKELSTIRSMEDMFDVYILASRLKM